MCQNLYKNSFTYHSLKEDKTLPFLECLEFIEQVRMEKARVLVHCMSGQSRSPAVVIAYLMKHKQWRLLQAYQWVKDRRASINLTQTVAQQLQQFESEVFGNYIATTPIVSIPAGGVAFGFSYPAPALLVTQSPGQAPLFDSVKHPVIPSSSFVFGSAKHELRAATDHDMDSS